MADGEPAFLLARAPASGMGVEVNDRAEKEEDATARHEVDGRARGCMRRRKRPCQSVVPRERIWGTAPVPLLGQA